jgi:hypothetical protein
MLERSLDGLVFSRYLTKSNIANTVYITQLRLVPFHLANHPSLQSSQTTSSPSAYASSQGLRNDERGHADPIPHPAHATMDTRRPKLGHEMHPTPLTMHRLPDPSSRGAQVRTQTMGCTCHGCLTLAASCFALLGAVCSRYRRRVHAGWLALEH